MHSSVPTGSARLTAPDPVLLRVAVLSDLHAYESSTGATEPSHLQIGAREDIIEQHPISGLLDLIDKHDLKADLLLCPGDLADKAHPASLKYAWQQVHAVGKKLGAKVVATAGNHDVDSRFAHNDYDAKGVLQSLSPPFPCGDEARTDIYWSRNFSLMSGTHYRLVLLNSSAYHGYQAKDKPPEYEHGRITKATLSALDTQLAGSAEMPVNIVLCHHHPAPLNEFGDGDNEFMLNGDRLVDLLGTGKYGDWMIIHGHRHIPKLVYAQGNSSSPVIFSAGSLSATLFPRSRGRASNQFYIVEFATVDTAVNVTLPGRILVWDWTYGIGWSHAGTDSGLPALCGFGYRGSVSILAGRIDSLLIRDAVSWVDWKTLSAEIPELDFLTPGDMDRLRLELTRRKLNIGYIVPGIPAQVGRA
jgi:3',5'-cyclic AMP phosphodiesterase CpdA